MAIPIGTVDMVSGRPPMCIILEVELANEGRLSCSWSMEADGRQALCEMSNAY